MCPTSYDAIVRVKLAPLLCLFVVGERLLLVDRAEKKNAKALLIRTWKNYLTIIRRRRPIDLHFRPTLLITIRGCRVWNENLPSNKLRLKAFAIRRSRYCLPDCPRVSCMLVVSVFAVSDTTRLAITFHLRLIDHEEIPETTTTLVACFLHDHLIEWSVYGSCEPRVKRSYWRTRRLDNMWMRGDDGSSRLYARANDFSTIFFQVQVAVDWSLTIKPT
jgi:hypothetical protein